MKLYLKNKEIRVRNWAILAAALVLAAAVAFQAASCGDRRNENGSTYGEENSRQTQGTERGSYPESTAPGTDGHSESSRESTGEAGLCAYPPEDPQAPGYLYRDDLTQELFFLLAEEKTNLTGEAGEGLIRAEDKALLDEEAVKWMYGCLDDGPFKERLESGAVIQPFARIYRIPGCDMGVAEHRVRLSDVSAKTYLFIRVFYSAESDSCRIYLANGLIW